MTRSVDPYDLERFVAAQTTTYQEALAELRAGFKRSHWMWFIFPQLAGLGRSPMAQMYALGSLDEARAYIVHPLLRTRYQQCVEAMLGWVGRRDAAAILGDVDAAKLRSSLTLFERASGDDLFGRALDAFYAGHRDERTLALLQPSETVVG